ncbi:MAG: acyl-CoA thioesterase [Betaproteobacteria bacterium]|nr:acyl-CoA thioesterase [Betaproteobacteria bacterium]
MTVPIRWGDMDARAHVNNAQYMRYFEEARVAWSQARGLRQDDQAGFIVAKATVDYHAALTWPGNVISQVYAARVGNKSFTLRQTLTAEAAASPAATAEFVVVWFDYAAGVSAALPAPLRAILEGRA